MKLRVWLRDPFVEQVLAGLAVVIIGALVDWLYGWTFFSAAWAYLSDTMGVWRWLFWLLIIAVIALTLLLVRSKTVGKPIHVEDNDVLGVLTSWIGHHPTGIGGLALNYKELDRQLRLAPGSARKHIEQAARHYGYRVCIRGEQTILFEGGH